MVLMKINVTLGETRSQASRACPISIFQAAVSTKARLARAIPKATVVYLLERFAVSNEHRVAVIEEHHSRLAQAYARYPVFSR